MPVEKAKGGGDKPLKFGVPSTEFMELFSERKKYIVLPSETEHYSGELPKSAMVEITDLSNDKRKAIFKVTQWEEYDDESIIASITPLVKGAVSTSEVDGTNTKRKGGTVSPMF